MTVGRCARAHLTLGAVALVTLSSPCASGSEVPPEDRVLATELFNEGRALLLEERYAEACPKLQESERLDPGGGTLLNLALCHELEGRSATSWSEFHEALAAAQRDGREDRELAARAHIDALEPRLARLVVIVLPDASLPGLVVRRDGSVLGPAAWGAAVPLDRGRHTIVVEAPGRVTWTTDVEIEADGVTRVVQVPPLDAIPAPGSHRSAAVVAAAGTSPPARPTVGAVRSWQRPTALGFGILGTAGLVVGAVFGVEAGVKWHEAQPRCMSGRCDIVGYNLWRRARQEATIANILVPTGAAFLGGGYVFLADGAFAWPRPDQTGLESHDGWDLLSY